jgi:hypothetical protein
MAAGTRVSVPFRITATVIRRVDGHSARHVEFSLRTWFDLKAHCDGDLSALERLGKSPAVLASLRSVMTRVRLPVAAPFSIAFVDG